MRNHAVQRMLAGGALVLLGPMSAHGQADGGTTSVFAFGAGNRALGMGGAFTALASDASAPVWNAAGLGRLQRGELQVSHASLYGLGISDQYLSLAYPSWRWGTAALTFRRFAVTGIEQRDERNFVIADDLSDSETEVALSFGRPVGAAWHLGGAVKLRRQSLAGFGDSGLGLDVGMLVNPGEALGRDIAWLDRVSLGLSLRNLIEPSLRLDQESVSDPTMLRGGVAYRHPFLTDGSIVAALDLDKSRHANTHFHAGVEVTPHPLLTLRAGWNDGLWTSGSSVRWRLASFDYLFESGNSEFTQRFGVSWRFGQTVTDRRLAAARAEEEEFRRKLEDSFAQRQRERVDELVAEAEALIGRSEFEEALDLLALVRTLDPENTWVPTLEASCLYARAAEREGTGALADAIVLYGRVLAVDPDHRQASAAIARCRAESNARAARTLQIRELFATALDAFTASDFPTARVQLEHILEISPEDAEAKAMLARTRTAIAARAGSLLGQARRFLERGLLTEAEELLEETRRLDPRAEGLASLDERLAAAEKREAAAERARRQEAGSAKVAAAESPVAPKRPVLSQKKLQEIDGLYRSGIEAKEAGRADDALRYWELVWLADPGYQEVVAYLKQEYLLRGLESFSHGSLERAISLWEKALDVDPDDEKAQGYLARAREQLARIGEISRSRR